MLNGETVQMKHLTKTPMEHALEAYLNDRCIFYSDKNWLHPLFDFQRFLKREQIPRETILLKDAIIGRAAALLLIYLGIQHVYTPTLSRHGKEVLDYFDIDYTYETLVKEIGCQTERLLQGVWQPEEAYRIITDRIAARKGES